MATKRRKKSGSANQSEIDSGGGVASIVGGGVIPGSIGTNRPDTIIGAPPGGSLSPYPYYDFPDPYVPRPTPKRKPPQRGLQVTPGIPPGKTPPRITPPSQIIITPNAPYDFPDPYIPLPTRPRQITPGIPRDQVPPGKTPKTPRKPKPKKPKGRGGGSRSQGVE